LKVKILGEKIKRGIITGIDGDGKYFLETFVQYLIS